MFNESYEFRKSIPETITEDQKPRRRHAYVFFNRMGRKFIVWADEFEPNDIYAIKFFPASHKKSKDKFKVMTEDADVQRTIRTCINIMLDIRKQKPTASFAILAEPKRFSVYRKVMERFFSDIEYKHECFENGNDNLYLMRNRAFSQAHPEIVENIDAIIKHYEFTTDAV